MVLVRIYNPGKATVRERILRNGSKFVYFVDVHEPSVYGIELADWLRRGAEYELLRKQTPNFPDCLHGPIWVTQLKDGTVLRRWWLETTPYR